MGDMIAVHSTHPKLHRVLLDEAPSSDAQRDPQSAFERDYRARYTAAVATYRARRTGAADATVALIISDAIDGMIHNAARRGTLGSPAVKSELVRMIGLYLGIQGEPVSAEKRLNG